MSEMTKPYCDHAHGRQAGWSHDPVTGNWVAKCGLPSRLVWEATQKSCDEVGPNHTTPGTIDVDGTSKEMKEIEMSEHEHPEFEANNCPACGTSADLTTDPLVDEDAIKTAVQEAFDEANAAVDRIVAEPLPVRIRTLRESLGLSRKQVQDATGLGASVVWRAEQEGKDVGDENYTKIWDMLTACQKSGHFPAKERKSYKAETPTGEAAQLIAEWTAKTWELRGVIDAAYELAEAKRTIASDAKRSTRAWDELLEILEPHITTK